MGDTDLDLAEIRKKCLKSLYSCTGNVSKFINTTEKAVEFEKLRNCVKEYCKMEQQHESQLQTILASQDDTDLDELGRTIFNIPNISPKHPYLIKFEDHVKVEESRNQVAEDDSEMAIVGTQDTYIDLISLKRIVNPMKNTICGHIYEKESIENFIKSKNKRCPYFGCTNAQVLTAEHLVLDEELRLTLQSQQQDS